RAPHGRNRARNALPCTRGHREPALALDRGDVHSAANEVENLGVWRTVPSLRSRMFGTSLREARSFERLVSTPLTTFEALVGESPLSFTSNEGKEGGREALASAACDLAEALA